MTGKVLRRTATKERSSRQGLFHSCTSHYKNGESLSKLWGVVQWMNCAAVLPLPPGRRAAVRSKASVARD